MQHGSCGRGNVYCHLRSLAKKTAFEDSLFLGCLFFCCLYGWCLAKGNRWNIVRRFHSDIDLALAEGSFCEHYDGAYAEDKGCHRPQACIKTTTNFRVDKYELTDNTNTQTMPRKHAIIVIAIAYKNAWRRTIEGCSKEFIHPHGTTRNSWVNCEKTCALRGSAQNWSHVWVLWERRDHRAVSKLGT